MRPVRVADAMDEVGRLTAAGYNVPRDSNTAAIAQSWAEHLDCEVGDLSQAITAYIREGGRYWPQIAELRRLALDAKRERGGFASHSGDLESRYRRWEQNHTCGPCPICGAVLQLLSSEQIGGPKGGTKRYGVYHDVQKHRRHNIPHVGPPYLNPTDG